MDDNKIQKIVGAGSIAGILLMIVLLFSNGTFGGGSITSAAGLDSNGIMQMDEGEEGEEMEGDEMEEGDEMDEDEMDDDEDEDEDEMDEGEDEDENEGGVLGFDFGFGLFGEKD